MKTRSAKFDSKATFLVALLAIATAFVFYDFITAWLAPVCRSSRDLGTWCLPIGLVGPFADAWANHSFYNARLLASLQLAGTPVREGFVLEAPDSAAEADMEYAELLAAMGWDPVDADSLVARSGLTIGEVSSMLLMLELQGSVRALSSGRYQRAGKKGSVDI